MGARPLDPSLSDSATSPLPTATMSDDGERTCPLCAEEMDLTDQQLKPCKCGYETCSNPDCLYLHDIGSQEDSFTKDEIISLIQGTLK
ncbi:RNA recognition [Musa troglodytarum]|uniref:RNA recognition n=1 Tax=Musa troglodytarum TaxID=320322 RepID=A0A9E7KPE1_9LILI|nr:RNA recognition [Musa troglodytarum]